MSEEKNEFRHDYTRLENGVRLHHVSVGEGSPVLLIPGYLQTWYAWRHVMRGLADAGFRAIAVDPRGTGHSSRPASGYDTGNVAADLHALMKSLGHSRFFVAGHDVGMWIGYALAADYPQAVERLALMEAFIPGLAQSPLVFGAPGEFMRRWHFLFNQLPDLPEFLLEGKERGFMTWLFDQWAYRRDTIATDAYVNAYSVPGAMRAALGYYRAIPETIAQNERRAQTKLSMPVLAIGGQYAAGDAPRAMLSPVTENLTAAILPACGHIVPEEAPEALLGYLIPHFKKAAG